MSDPIQTDADDRTAPDAAPELRSEADFEELAKRGGHGVGAVAGRLRRAIETGVYSDGDQLPPERELAAAFRTARSTIRRALDQLERAGLVSRKMGSGTFVTAPNQVGQAIGDVTDALSPLQLIDARFAVEPHTTKLAVFHATRLDLDSIETVLDRLDTCEEDKEEFAKWDAEFHLLIARASRNPLLVLIYQQINDVRLHAQWHAMKEQILTPEQIRVYNRQHRGIFEAMCQRDAQAARELIVEHLEKARADLLQASSG